MMVVDWEIDMKLVRCVVDEEDDACCRVRSVVVDVASIA
jgi:hypothetical protein